MTKKIRVENADTGLSFQAVMQVWDRGVSYGPAEGEVEPDKLVREIPLGFPTAMAEEYITSTRYLVIKEVQPNTGDSA